VLFFTAAAGEAGTSTVLLNLAVTIAREAEPRVLVIDANLDRPAVAERLALKKPAPGLAEVLAQQVPLVWAAQASAVPNLQVLTAGTPTPESPAVLGQDLPKLIDQLRQWYDWVLIDAGVWGAMPERDAVCPSADAVYLVTRAGDVDRSEFAGLRGWVRELGGLLRGYIATRT
jgi:Mrp family chromosome partitioning ATPase